MAEGPGPGSVDMTLKTLEEEITCPVCHEHFEDPRVLPCSHYYCRDCVQLLSNQAGFHQPFSCPECRSLTHLPQQDASHLPKALAVIRMKNLHSEHLKRQPAPRKMCSKHSDHPLLLFCSECKCLICGMCVAFDHKTHTYKLVSEITPIFRDQLRKVMAPLSAAHKYYTNTTERAKEKIFDVQTQNTNNSEAVNQWIKEWMEIIQQCGHNIIRYSSDILQKKVGNLRAQIKDLESQSASVQSLLKYCEQNLENATDEEFIELHQQMLSQVEEECRKHIDTNLKLADDADVEVELPSNQTLKKLCRNEANVLVGVHACCTVDLKNAEIKKSLCFTVHYTRSQNGALWKKPQAVEGEMISLVDGSLIRLKGKQKKEGIYEMMYTPQIRGRHQLAVTVNGKQVAGNPFTTCAKIPPTQLGTLVRAISGLSRPYSVAFNSAGEVLITSNKEIRVFDNHGKDLRTIKQDFQGLVGIAVDKEDNIFVSDNGPHCVYKLDKDGNQLKVIGQRGNGNGEFKDAKSLAVIGEHVFVCDSNNHRIQVFTRELDFVKIIGSHGKGNGQFKGAFDISQDEAGNLYVCDCGNHRIQVLRNDGEFLHSFGTEGKDKGQLDRPTSVCYSDLFVYVSELGNHGVSVFNRKGHFITSFGNEGLTNSYFSRPFILRVDQDGFVYVCDYGNNRVLIF